MLRTGIILAACLSLSGMAHAVNATLLQRDFSTQPRELVICAFEPDPGIQNLASAQFDLVDWQGYMDRDITILELSRARSASHVPTSLGPITTELSMSPQERERTARGYGCAMNADTILLFGKDGTEKARWTETVKKHQLYRVIDTLPVRRFEMSTDETLQ